MRLVHNSTRPLDGLVLRSVQQADRHHHKPRGFWLAVIQEDGTDEWVEWCAENDFFDFKDSHFTAEFRIQDAGRVLTIGTEDELLAFTAEFVSTPENPRLSDLTLFVDWARVASRWSGIAISPYQCRLRYDRRCEWYYAWDVASACIWDVSCLKRVDVPALLEAA